MLITNLQGDTTYNLNALEYLKVRRVGDTGGQIVAKTIQGELHTLAQYLSFAETQAAFADFNFAYRKGYDTYKFKLGDGFNNYNAI